MNIFRKIFSSYIPEKIKNGTFLFLDNVLSIKDVNNILPLTPGRFRFKEKPDPFNYLGMAIITDIGDPYSVWFSDGMNWKPFAGALVIEQAHQPGNGMTGSSAGGTGDLGFGLSSSFTIFPLGKQFDILSNLIGMHGSLRIHAKFTATNNANNHEVGLGAGLKYTSNTIIVSSNSTNWDTKILDITISNRGSETTKTVTTRVTTINGTNSTDVVSTSNITLDTSIDQKFWFYGCLKGNAADTISLDSFIVELLKA